jgi:uncharacterized protein Yka (UPF0111/DUF47 family)
MNIKELELYANEIENKIVSNLNRAHMKNCEEDIIYYRGMQDCMWKLVHSISSDMEGGESNDSI